SGEPCVAHVAFARVFTQLDHLGDLIDEVELTEVAPFVVETADGPVFVVDRPTVVRIGRLPVLPHHVHATRFLDRRGLGQYVRSSFFEYAVVRAGEEITVSGVIT